MSEEDEDGAGGPMRKPKGRWALTEEGRVKMEEAYAHSRFPNSGVRQRLCKEVGGSMRQIQVWFQNRRQRDKLHYREWPNVPIVVMNHPNMPAGYYANGAFNPMMGPGMVPQPGMPYGPGGEMMAGAYAHPGMMPGMPGVPGMPFVQPSSGAMAASASMTSPPRSSEGKTENGVPNAPAAPVPAPGAPVAPGHPGMVMPHPGMPGGQMMYGGPPPGYPMGMPPPYGCYPQMGQMPPGYPPHCAPPGSGAMGAMFPYGTAPSATPGADPLAWAETKSQTALTLVETGSSTPAQTPLTELASPAHENGTAAAEIESVEPLANQEAAAAAAVVALGQ